MDHNVRISKIEQKDNFTFSLTFLDGKVKEYRLSELQKRCPCSACQAKKSNPDTNVKATLIKNVGLYALSIKFTSGCSHGIYSLKMLYDMNEEII